MAEPALLGGCWPPIGSGRRNLCLLGQLPPAQVRGGYGSCWHYLLRHLRIPKATPRGTVGILTCSAVLDQQPLRCSLALLAGQLGHRAGGIRLDGYEERHVRCTEVMEGCRPASSSPPSWVGDTGTLAQR